METSTIILYSLAVVAILLQVIWVIKRDRTSAKEIQEYEKSRNTFDYYRILPFEVKRLLTEKTLLGLHRLQFTATSLRQEDEHIFVIGVKALWENEKVGFELYINGAVQLHQQEGSKEITPFHYIVLNTYSTESDRLLHVLTHLFNVELSNKSQMVKVLPMLTAEQYFDLETIQKEEITFVAHFADKEVVAFSPALRFILDLKNGKVILEETDLLFRQMIINRLTFKPNIKN